MTPFAPLSYQARRAPHRPKPGATSGRTSVLTDDYRVRLESFEGPLDLLLFLIRKSEVEITDIPVAAITEQYLEFLKDLGSSSRIDIDTAGEFLVMAATLMELKSRMLMPAPARSAADAPGDKPQEDPRAELVRQLIEY